VTSYGLDGPVIESRNGDISRTRLDRPLSPLTSLYNEYRVEEWQQRGVDHTPQFSVEVKEKVTGTLPLDLHGMFYTSPVPFTTGSVIFADVPTTSHASDSSRSAVFVSV